MKGQRYPRTERAQLAMMLEVVSYPKPGNVDRCHDYPDTRLEHFLASIISARRGLERAEEHDGRIGEIFRQIVADTSWHGGGNTHFGAFILLVPLVMGGDIEGACREIRQTTVADAIDFYRAFALTGVRLFETDELDVNSPDAIDMLCERKMTLLDVMRYSAPRDMVAREWTEGFPLTKRAARLLHQSGSGCGAIVRMFSRLLADELDTFIIKKHGAAVAEETRRRAREVLAGRGRLEELDDWCISRGVNPGSLADITIAGIYVALTEGWEWDSSGRG
ncbi:MAG: triphosphoribosyl-dephospho-CoA synthase [Methanoculleaceae archaeon]